MEVDYEKFELGVSSCGVQDLTEKDFESCANAGISAMELSLAPPGTIKRRMLTHADFKENYNSLMKGEKPKIIGTPLV